GCSNLRTLPRSCGLSCVLISAYSDRPASASIGRGLKLSDLRTGAPRRDPTRVPHCAGTVGTASVARKSWEKMLRDRRTEGCHLGSRSASPRPGRTVAVARALALRQPSGAFDQATSASPPLHQRGVGNQRRDGGVQLDSRTAQAGGRQRLLHSLVQRGSDVPHSLRHRDALRWRIGLLTGPRAMPMTRRWQQKEQPARHAIPVPSLRKYSIAWVIRASIRLASCMHESTSVDTPRVARTASNANRWGWPSSVGSSALTGLAQGLWLDLSPSAGSSPDFRITCVAPLASTGLRLFSRHTYSSSPKSGGARLKVLVTVQGLAKPTGSTRVNSSRSVSSSASQMRS